MEKEDTLKDKSGDILFFVIINQSHEKTKSNNDQFIVCLHCPTYTVLVLLISGFQPRGQDPSMGSLDKFEGLLYDFFL